MAAVAVASIEGGAAVARFCVSAAARVLASVVVSMFILMDNKINPFHITVVRMRLLDEFSIKFSYKKCTNIVTSFRRRYDSALLQRENHQTFNSRVEFRELSKETLASL